MGDAKASQIEEFREGLEGVIEIAQRLSTHVTTVEDLIGVVKLALENDSQLRILMTITLQQGKTR